MIWNRDAVISLLTEAGRIALEYSSHIHLELKPDHSIVTEADRAVESFLTERLEDESAGVRLIGEETFASRGAEYIRHAVSGSSWIVDPIDGTSEYSHRIPLWGISIGWASEGTILEGGILLPESGELLISDRGRTYYGKSKEFCFDLKELHPQNVIPDESCMISLSQRYCRHSSVTLRNPLNCYGSTVYPIVLMATGRCIGMSSHAKLWDFAGGLPSLKNLGFRSWSRRGNDYFSMKITPELYNLKPDSPQAFSCGQQLVYAVNDACAEYLVSGLNLNESQD